ncbi:hypothetical protein FOA43_000116 [Brettanomyces nanus]|uniref:Autophagy-related protein 3 n=1 Tax=Eeniella nana TaxID=13502 RepID=A0A875S027_EENNA|nr:uncharacterized protein FOA43_000116 [Brettanomyces nanus]QPG72814.1 hypothetical protein FOA43_000116 [Brettanomyces nanus]
MASEYIRSTFSSLREYLTPVTHTSTFITTGEITPEEFVQAGDYLVYKFPTWQWSPAPESRRRDFLPQDKQFLVTRHVPSYVRAIDYEKGESSDNMDEFTDSLSPEEAWTSPQTKGIRRHCTPEDERRHSMEYVQMKESGDTVSGHSITTRSSGEGDIRAITPKITDESTSLGDEDFINDIDELIDDEAEEFIEGEHKNPENSREEIVNDPSKRSYDLYIAYSTSYRVPKMYMVGFDLNGAPLTPEQMFQDIASDYRHKTVTIEKAPFLTNTTSVSIHPCRHATVMRALMKMASKKIHNVDETQGILKGVSKLGLADAAQQTSSSTATTTTANAEADDEDWESLQDQPQSSIRVDQYLIIFLKFMASVTPGIEHDYTMDAL